MKVLTVGGGAREHAIVEALRRSGATVVSVMKNRNPGIAREAEEVLLEDEKHVGRVVEWAGEMGAEMAVIGPEAPLGAGIVDSLEVSGVPTVGPTEAAAQIELSKEFARDLMHRHGIPGLVDYWAFDDLGEIQTFLVSHPGDVVVKPIGLTGGKGVKIQGEHLETQDDVLRYCAEVLEKPIGGQSRLLLEEKVVGEEFSLQTFSDGRRLVPMPVVRDHKRALEGDTGPNTGGMGSFSMEDGSLPFLRPEELQEAVGIMQNVVDALRKEGAPFKGILYGGFILTKDGPKVLEFNARFGDPEAMNVLPILESNFLDICRGIADGSLPSEITFRREATVCKYVVPVGYGAKPLKGEVLSVDESKLAATGARLYYASVDEVNGKVYTTTSRCAGVVGIAENVRKAEAIAEAAAGCISGRVYVRHDIGKEELLARYNRRMEELRRSG
jgi:phosphoribosylamine--glycine ligase